MLSKSCRLASILNLALLASAAQPHSHHVEVTSQGLLRADEKLQPKPRLATCAGRKLDCAGADDPCAQATDCNAHHACTGSGHRNCMKNTELSGQAWAAREGCTVPWVLYQNPLEGLSNNQVWKLVKQGRSNDTVESKLQKSERERERESE